MATPTRFDLRNALRMGLIAGSLTVSVAAIGLVELFAQRELVAGVITMGQVLIFISPAFVAYMTVRHLQASRPIVMLDGFIIGAVSALPSVALIALGTLFNLRQFMPGVSPTMIDILSLELGPVIGSVALTMAMGIVGMAGAVFQTLADNYRRPLMAAIIWTLTLGLFSEILASRVRAFLGTGATALFFSGKALSPIFALVAFVAIAGGNRLWSVRGSKLKSRIDALPPERQRRVQYGTVAAGVLLLILLPLLLGTYLSEVFNTVGLYILAGLGLNIVVGFAGLLDLGYVAFFAIGAYSMAVLTSQGSLGLVGLNFWEALPFCVLISAAAGIVLGVPVLRMRGDYLAIVTLGFGEIIRILALSDMLKPLIGGAQGVLKIPKPPLIAGISLVQPTQFYYVVLAGCLLAAFVSYRLGESRLGRQWMAMREDEDVAEAMGIKLVSAKLLAFACGAAFSGLAGALFASKLTSIFPHSFNLIFSINVLCLIIIGGMGSLPGVVVGALILVGLPELLREFAEYRLLMYGALLVVMMLAKPEGFWPSAVRQRELQADQEVLQAQRAALESGD